MTEVIALQKKTARLLLTALGALLGAGLIRELLAFMVEIQLLTPDHASVYPWISLLAYILGVGVFTVLSYFFSLPCSMAFIRLMRWIEGKLSSVPMIDMIFGCAGLLVGLLIAFLITFLFLSGYSTWVATLIGIAIYVLFGYLGTTIGVKRWRELNFSWVRKLHQQTERANAIPEARGASVKLLDTSVIIDGRIFDICKTGILEGKIVIPEFVLSELRHVADSADALRRSKGRRGLDILGKMQRELEIPVEISQADYEELAEADAKLLRLARELGGKIVTNDFNLNKVAAVQGIPVLNINELAGAIRPVLLPGEVITVRVIKEGKDAAQGVAYLDDGTMVVVENGGGRIGEEFAVTVTSALQTAAGRMIFARDEQA